jgi:RCC1 and BTB domain-containing protein
VNAFSKQPMNACFASLLCLLIVHSHGALLFFLRKLGHGAGRKVSIPQLVEKLKNYRVVRVASYNEHTAALVEPFDHSGGYAPGAVNAVAVTASYTSQMRGLVNDEEFADVTFIIEGEGVHAHRAILAQRCEHFAAMFRSGMRESVERTITIPNVSKQVFLLLLEYLYTDSVKIDVEYAIDLYITSDLYRLERLRDMCCTVVRRNLSAENAGPLLQLASEAHCQVLKDVCMNYILMLCLNRKASSK